VPNGGNAIGSGQGAGMGVADGPVPRTHHPPLRDLRDDLRNSFHRPKLNFPMYDDEFDPLPWLPMSPSVVHRYCQLNKSVWHPCIWTALPLDSTTL
jgi:hypothetical protein